MRSSDRIADTSSRSCRCTSCLRRDAFWRWLKLPEWHSVRISEILLTVRRVSSRSLGVFWIDEDDKAETLEARASGRTFPPIDDRRRDLARD